MSHTQMRRDAMTAPLASRAEFNLKLKVAQTRSAVSKLSVLIVLMLLLAALSLRAVDRTWNGPAGGLWSNAANWNPTGVPQSGDNVNFDGFQFGSSNFNSVADNNFNAQNTVARLTIRSFYGGTITLGSNFTLTVGSGGVSVAGGTLDVSAGLLQSATSVTQSGGTIKLGTSSTTSNLGTLQISGGVFNSQSQAINCVSFLQTNGTFTAPSAFMQDSGNWVHSGGTFIHNSGRLNFIGATALSIDAGNALLNDIALRPMGDAPYKLANSDIAIGGTFFMREGTFDANGRSMTVAGFATVSTGTLLCGTGTLNFNGGLTVTGDDAFALVNGTVNCGSGIVNVTDFELLGSLGNFFGVGVLNLGSGPFNVSGKWSRPTYPKQSIFTPGTGTVTFNKSSGTQTLDSGGTGGDFFNLTHSGAGTLQLLNNNMTVAGAFTQTAGALDAAAQTLKFSGGVNMSGGLIKTTSPSFGEISLLSSLTASEAGGTQPLLQGHVKVYSGGGTFTVNGASSQLTVDATIDGITNAGLTKAGLGTLLLSQANSYAGVTVVNEGTLALGVLGNSASSAHIVNSGGTLIGLGTIGTLTVNSGGVLKLDTGATAALTVQGNAAFNPGSIVNFNISGALVGKLLVNGAVNITGATLSGTTTAPNIALGMKFTVISSTALSGTFANLPEGSSVALSGLAFSITYAGGTGNDVVLTRINSPPVIDQAPFAQPSAGSFAQTIGFSALAHDPDGQPVSYSWNFGDNAAGSGPNVTHKYVAAGSYAVTLTVTDGEKSTTAILNLSLTDSLPVLDSAPSATPGVAGVGQSIVFSVVAHDPDGEPVTIAWDFSDGLAGSGPSVTHAFATAGTFSVIASVTDGVNTTTAMVSVTVNAPLVGQGPDKDGDGFSDDFETVAGTDPANFAITPTGNPASATGFQPLTITKASIKLNFAKPMGFDSIAFSGTLAVPAGFKSNGAKVSFDVAGVSKTLTLNAKGTGVGNADSVKISIKSKKGVVAAQTAKYSVNFKKGSFSTQLASAGLTNTTAKAMPVTVPFTIIFDKAALKAAQTMSYTANTGKTGAAK